MGIKENTDFFENVYRIVNTIPRGKVTTYGAIARALGLRSSARMVGWALSAIAGGRAEGPGAIPAHRVVNRNGELTGKMHFSTPEMMRELLESEGVKFNGDAVDLKKHLWEP